MNEIHITAWTGEDTDLNENLETWAPSFAAHMYGEHVLDSIADWQADRDIPNASYYRPVPMTFRWDRRENKAPSGKSWEETE